MHTREKVSKPKEWLHYRLGDARDTCKREKAISENEDNLSEGEFEREQ